MPDRLLTVAIHTYEKAILLKSLLEAEGIEVTLQNVNLVQPVVSSGVRVRIHEADLPLALRVIENTDLRSDSLAQAPDSPLHRGHLVLIPVEGHPAADPALKQALRLAALNDARALLLHIYLAPASIGRGSAALSDSLTFITDSPGPRSEQRAADDAHRTAQQVAERVRAWIKAGEVPPVRFDVQVEEGVVEEVINRVARAVQPLFMVLATRGQSQKERDMMGSVAAEVLDTCRQTIVTIPLTSSLGKLGREASLSALYFGNLDQADMLALDSMHRLLGKMRVDVSLVHVPEKKALTLATDPRAMDNLLAWCRESCPRFTFRSERVAPADIGAGVGSLIEACGADILVMPGKRRNVFARFFNPTLPHRLLFAANVPMLVIPV